MRYLIAAIALLSLVGCAGKTPPPPPVVIPVQLVNISDNTVVIPAKPDTGPVYVEGETVRDALRKWVAQGLISKQYEAELLVNLTQCTVDNSAMRENLHNIKKFILLNQGPAQAGPN